MHAGRLKNKVPGVGRVSNVAVYSKRRQTDTNMEGKTWRDWIEMMEEKWW